MASRWTRHSSNSSIDGRSSNSGSGQRTPKVSSASSSSWDEPPSLDESCIKYILSVMVLFIRQTASSDVPLMLATRSTDISFRDFDDRVNIKFPVSAISVLPPPLPLPAETSPRSRPSASSISSAKINIKSISHISAANAEYENTHMSLVNSSIVVNDLIAKYVGRIIFHLSASNWKVVFERFSDKINFIATNPELTPDSIDLQFMSHCVMDRTRLVVLLNRASFYILYIYLLISALLLNKWTELSSLLVNMTIESQRTIAIHLRSAIWNWIDVFPSEFNDAIRTKGKTGAPERVFDLIHSLAHAGSESVFWPTLTILNCISSDRISAEFQYGNFTHTNRKVIIQVLYLFTVAIEALYGRN